MSALFLIIGIAFLLSCIPLAFVLARAYFSFRGPRVVTCPETCAPVAVEVDAARAAVTATLDEAQLRLKACSRWPERQDCGQECLSQIEAAPEDCLVRTMLTKWYEGSTCALCGKAIGEIHWIEHKPALMSPERKTMEWYEVPPEKLPDVLATHLRVCWNCHIAESFRARYPGLVVDDPWHPVRRPAGDKTDSAA